MQTVENASELHCIALSPSTQDCIVIAALRGQADAASIKLAGPNSLDVRSQATVSQTHGENRID